MYVDVLTDATTALLTSSPSDTPERINVANPTRATCQPIALLGVVFDNLTMRETVDRIEEMIRSRLPHYVVTANVDFLAQARRDVELQRILLDAPLVLCDGTPLVWTSRLFGNSLPERVAGADVVPELIRMAAKKNYRLFFLGTTEDANTRAIAKLRAQFPDLEISHYSPPFRALLEMDDAEIIRRIRAAKPDLLFVAFGCPKAEKWLARHHRKLDVPVAMGVGATIDFLAGNVKRAPLWMQRGGAEWIFRLCQEPQRLFKRYAADLWYFSGATIRQWWTIQGRVAAKREQTRTSIIQSENTWLRVEASTCLNQKSIQVDAVLWNEISKANSHCLLELAKTKSMDSTGVAMLVHLHKQLRCGDRQLILLSPSLAVRRVLKMMRLENFFEVANDALEARAAIETRSHERCALLRRDSTNPLGSLSEKAAIHAAHNSQCSSAAINRARAPTKSSTIDLATVRFVNSGGLMLPALETAHSRSNRQRSSDPPAAVRNSFRVSNRKHLLDQPA